MPSENALIKALHIDNSIAFTGAIKSLKNICNYSKHRIYSIIILPKGSMCKKMLEENGIKVYEIPFIELSKKPLNLFLYIPFLFINAWRISRIARRENIDIFHNNDLYNMSFYIVKYFFGLKKPLIVHVRLLPASFPAIIYNVWKFINIRWADKLVGVSCSVKRAYNNTPKMDVIYNIDLVPEKHLPYEFNFDKKRPFRFIYLANYIYGKGQDYALSAFEILAKRNPEVEITFVGGDMGLPKNRKYKKELIECSIKLGLANKVFFEDFTDDIELKLKEYDGSLNFSFSESFSLVSYESLKYGIPFISSDCGGPAELFVNGESGFLVKNKSVIEMAEAMYQLSTNPDLAKKFSFNSKKYISEVISKHSSYDLFIKYMIESTH
jgi:glycosyltransferase involved in cell wall biosynthesis